MNNLKIFVLKALGILGMLIVLAMVGGTIAAVLNALFPAQALGSDITDEPIIVTEIPGRRDTIVTGVKGDEAVNLYRTERQTLGTVGDQVILINHVPERRFRTRLRTYIEPELLSEESIGNPLEDGRDK